MTKGGPVNGLANLAAAVAAVDILAIAAVVLTTYRHGLEGS